MESDSQEHGSVFRGPGGSPCSQAYFPGGGTRGPQHCSTTSTPLFPGPGLQAARPGSAGVPPDTARAWGRGHEEGSPQGEVTALQLLSYCLYHRLVHVYINVNIISSVIDHEFSLSTPSLRMVCIFHRRPYPNLPGHPNYPSFPSL